MSNLKNQAFPLFFDDNFSDIEITDSMISFKLANGNVENFFINLSLDENILYNEKTYKLYMEHYKIINATSHLMIIIKLLIKKINRDYCE